MPKATPIKDKSPAPEISIIIRPMNAPKNRKTPFNNISSLVKT